MILVVGGTGRLGRSLVPMLVQDGQRVRVMSRGSSAPAPEASAAVEHVRGDLGSARDCERAVAGCRNVVFAASGFGLRHAGDPRSVDRDGAVRIVEAAMRGRVQHIIMMSMHSAAPDAPLEILRMKEAAEEAVRSSGIAWTAIRIGPLLEQFLVAMAEPLEKRGAVLVFGSGRAPVTFTTTADAAAIARRALLDPGLRGRTIQWGSETHTFDDLARTILEREGRGRVRRIPDAGLRAMAALARPVSPFMQRMAEAALWMGTGAAQFDPRPARAEFPDIPVTGLREVFAATS
jgi:uncharacterized protein YbjT (DUF2867 family)